LGDDSVRQFPAIVGLALLLAACQPQRPGVRVWTTGSVTAENLAVAADGELRAGFYTATIRDDCSQVGKVSVRATMEPVNGVLKLADSADFPGLRLPAADKRMQCNGRKFPGVLVTYKPNAGFTGEDQFGLDVIWPNGNSVKRNVVVHVR
jgi:hypothetical protein